MLQIVAPAAFGLGQNCFLPAVEVLIPVAEFLFGLFDSGYLDQDVASLFSSNLMPRSAESSPLLHKQHGNEGLRSRNYIIYLGSSITGWISLEVNSKKMADLAKLFTFRESRRAPFLPPWRDCQGFAVAHYSVTHSALTLKHSDFCNVRILCRWD
jgi:hypothetical protein